jgi:hypothetical protein
MQEQGGEESTLPRSTERNDTALVVDDLDGPEDAELHTDL